MEKNLLKPSETMKLIKTKNLSKREKTKVWKDSEKQLANFALTVDDLHPKLSGFLKLNKSLVGNITGLGVDVITKNFVWENKKRETLPQWLIKIIINLLERAESFGLNGILSLDIQMELENNKLGLKRLPRLFILSEKTLKKILERNLNE